MLVHLLQVIARRVATWQSNGMRGPEGIFLVLVAPTDVSGLPRYAVMMIESFLH